MTESQNRAFMYGESVFTTMKMVDGELIDWHHHFERLRRSVDFVYGPFTDGERWAAILRDRLEEKCSHLSGDKIVRLALYRDQVRGLLRPSLISIVDLRINIQSSQYEPSGMTSPALKLRTCPAILRPGWWPDYLKAGNYLETILCQKVYLKNDDDDLLFLTPEGTILESSVANIFVVKNNKLYTAPAGPNVLEGVIRKKVMANYQGIFDECHEARIALDQACSADGVFGSNSVRGLFLIEKIDETVINYNQSFMHKFEEIQSRVNK